MKDSPLFPVVASVIALSATPAFAAPTDPHAVIPPVVLQGCAQKVKPRHGHIYADRHHLYGNETGKRVVGFDLSFVNTSQQVAKVVMIRIGDTDFAKVGKFSPDAVIAWRLAARPGACEVRAVRFDDGTEWSAPTPQTTSSDASGNDND